MNKPNKNTVKDRFQGSPELLGFNNSNIFGYTEGFITTTDFVPSKGVKLSKNDVAHLWQQLKSKKELWKCFENHRKDEPPVGYVYKAELQENKDWSGIFVVTAIISQEALEKFKNGQLGGYSIAIRSKGEVVNVPTSTKIASLDLEAKAYTEKQVQKFKESFVLGYRVTTNEVYRFSEIPPLIINLAVNVDVTNIIAIFSAHPTRTVLAGGGILVLKKILELATEDIYEFVKKTAKELFNNKGKRKPILLSQVDILGKEVFIRNTSSDEIVMVKNAKIAKKYIKSLTQKQLKQLTSAHKIVIIVNDGSMNLELDDRKTIKI